MALISHIIEEQNLVGFLIFFSREREARKSGKGYDKSDNCAKRSFQSVGHENLLSVRLRPSG